MFKVIDFIKQIFEGRTISRIFLNWQIRENCKDLKGKTVDLASGGDPSYYKYLPPCLKTTKTDYTKKKGVDVVVDLNKELPFENNSVDNILFFGAFYIIKDRIKLLGEMKRVLKTGGTIFLSMPFIANEMPEPDDYCRLTYQGLEREFKLAGFENFKIIRQGERFTAGAFLLHSFFIFNIVRLFVYSLCIFLDKMIPDKIQKKHPTPVSYFCTIKK